MYDVVMTPAGGTESVFDLHLALTGETDRLTDQ